MESNCGLPNIPWLGWGEAELPAIRNCADSRLNSDLAVHGTNTPGM